MTTPPEQPTGPPGPSGPPPGWGTPQQPGYGYPPQPGPYQQQPPGYPAYPQYQQQPGYPYGYPPPVPTSSKASTVLVLGIVAIVTFFALCGLGVIPAVIALAMAPGARREIAESGGALQGDGQVRSGVIMSWVTLGLAALAIVVVIAIVALAVAASDGSGADSPDRVLAAFDLVRSAG